MQGQENNDRHFGLALSGGGFRAALYHLGVVRFLRDAGLLHGVTRITSVSGGSIIGAHMVLNWARYCGTEDQFQEVSQELIQLVRLDVRNRIVRRFPFMVVLNFLRRISLLGVKRQYTRTGLLEKHYEQFLYGDTALLELPDLPRLYILATDLSDGTLCAFCRDGLMLRRRTGSGSFLDVQTVQMGLATVPMAVAASSAFPGFFPPLELTGSDVGANEGEFPRHTFTDGGIYDNLGLRMFRYLNGLDLALEGKTQTDKTAITDRLDSVFVSDAGASLKIRADSRAGGILRTALRATDILMDRVNQLELDSFADTRGTVFIPITRVVDSAQDPTAMHPEIQKQVALIRTDLDSFTDLEIATLIQHGYCVARQGIRETAHLGDIAIPENPPWDAVAFGELNRETTGHALSDKEAVLPMARRLQRSSARRFLSKMFSRDDWPTYVLVPLIALVLLAVPTYLYKVRKIAFQQEQVLSAIAKSRPLYGDILKLLDSSEPQYIPTISFKDVDFLDPLDFSGYRVISDDRIYDLRGWTSSANPRYPAQMHARFQIMRNLGTEKKPTLRFQLPSEQENMRLAFLPDELKPTHLRAKLPDGDGYIYETTMDFSGVPIGSETTVLVRQEMPAVMAAQEFGIGRFTFTIAASTGLARIWVMLPPGRPHQEFHLFRYPIDFPDKKEVVHATTSVEVPTGSIATFQLINPPEGYRYEVRWHWLDEKI